MPALISRRPVETPVLPETTAERRLRQWLADPTAEQRFSPAIDTAALSAIHGMARAYEPKQRTMSFRIPVEWLSETGIVTAYWHHYEKLRDEYIKRWFRMVDKEGSDPFFGRLPGGAEARIAVGRGYYPAIDTLTGAALIDKAEVAVTAWFCQRNPKPVRLELPPELLTDTTAASLRGSSSGRRAA